MTTACGMTFRAVPCLAVLFHAVYIDAVHTCQCDLVLFWYSVTYEPVPNAAGVVVSFFT